MSRCAVVQLDTHLEEDEELPQYEPLSLPKYEQQPVAVFSLRQVDRKLQLLVPPNSACMTSYKIVHRTFSSIFSRKADMTLSAIEKSLGQEERVVATMNFDRDGPLPWIPRAEIRYIRRTEMTSIRFPLEAKNFAEWRITIGGSLCSWGLDDHPVSLLLVELSSGFILARFSYSIHGTLATKGSEVGELSIYGALGAEDGADVELTIASCAIAISHWRRMGRNYTKDTKLRMNTETTTV